MAKIQFDVLKEEFQSECKVINLKYEYEGYIGEEQWAIISELTEKEILEKYSEFISDYIPFLTLSPIFGKIRDDFRRNEKKHHMRSVRSIDAFGYEDEQTEQHHPELIADTLEASFLKNEAEKDLLEAVRMLKPIQRERLTQYYFQGKNASQIAKEEGVSSQAVDKSLAAAIKNLKKLLIFGWNPPSLSGNK